MKRIGLLLILLICFAFGDDKLPFEKIKGKKQYYNIMGNGQPLVVLITGMGVPMADMYALQERTTQLTRCFSYDRGGIGRSESLGEDRSIPVLAAELKELLEKVQVNRHLLLVGHSRGGLLARYFAKMYPNKVDAMLLLDPAVPEIKSQLRALRTAKENEKADSTLYVDFTMESTVPQAAKNEMKCYPKGDSTVMADTPLPKNIPITIITSVQVTADKHSMQDIAIKALFLKNLIADVPKAKLVLTDKSGHFIYEDEPQLVASELLHLLKQLRK